MELKVLYIDGCPNSGSLIAKVRRIIADREDVSFEGVLVDDENLARMANFHGSPTLLVNGRDPFWSGGSSSYTEGLACRVFLDHQGKPVATPSDADLERILIVD